MTRAFHAWAGAIPKPVCQPSVELSESEIRCAALTDSLHALELHRCRQPALTTTAAPSVIMLKIYQGLRQEPEQSEQPALSITCTYGNCPDVGVLKASACL